jgi:hypothetical protein
MDKKNGGDISHWQLHHLKYDESLREQFEQAEPRVDFSNIMMVTGTVVDDPTGRWEPGHHFRSSMIINVDREKNIIETLNTIYHFDPETEGQDSIFDIETGNKDLGNKVLNIFY